MELRVRVWTCVQLTAVHLQVKYVRLVILFCSCFGAQEYISCHARNYSFFCVSAPECRDIEMALYVRPYFFNKLFNIQDVI